MLRAKNIIYGFCKSTTPPKYKYLISIYKSEDLNVVAVFPTSQSRAGVAEPRHGVNLREGIIVSYVFVANRPIGTNYDGDDDFSFPKMTAIPFDYCFRDGGQEDLLKSIVDGIAKEISEEVVVQAFRDTYAPQNVRSVDFLPPDEFNELFGKARLIVAHAGMGTIISAMRQGKPIIVFPRIASLGEHRNEHQMATARQMERMNYVYVAYDEPRLRKLILSPDLKPLHHLDDLASKTLIDDIKRFVEER